MFGHRGASAHAVENTLESFLAAHAAGADGIELDVQRCASGELVVFHDGDLTRLAGRGERIAELSLAEVTGARLVDGARIPTLDAVFAALSGPDFRNFAINIELKSPGPLSSVDLADETLACIARHHMAGRVLVSSFDPVSLSRVRMRACHLATGLLFHSAQIAPLRRASLARILRPRALHPESSLVSRAALSAWRARGYAVNTWTVDDAGDQRRLAALGVDAIITNDPGACLRVLAGT